MSDTVAATRRVLVFGGHFLPGYKGGGPIRSLQAVLDSTDPDTACDVVVYDRDLGDVAPYPGLSGRVVRRGAHLVYYMDVRDPRHWAALARRVTRRSYDLMVVNSLWELSFAVVPALAAVAGVIRTRRLLIAPHGQLSGGALAYRSRSKRLLLRLWRPLLRRPRVMWHSTAAHESADIARHFPGATVITTTGGMGCPPASEVVASQPGPARLVFLSRISPVKNLALVLESLRDAPSPMALDIYGPVGDERYWAECERLLGLLPEHVSATYHGPVPPEQTGALFATHDAFVLPTLGENFGHAIAESLAAGCPVVTSTNTTWTGVTESGGGAAVADLRPQPYLAAILGVAPADHVQRTAHKAAALEAYRTWRHGSKEPNIITAALQERP